MALTVLTLRTQDGGEHRISCPLHSSLTMGSGEKCDITFEGPGIHDRHCVLYRTSERTFQIIAVVAAAQFSVNGVISSELEVNVPFKFGIGGEVLEMNLAEGEEEALMEADEVEGSGAEAGETAAGARPSRRGYLLKPITLKPRAGARVGEVILPAFPPPKAGGDAATATAEAVVVTKSRPTATELVDEADSEEESSFLLLAGLVVCAAMIAGIIYWPHHLDRLAAEKQAAEEKRAAVAEVSDEKMVRACAGLRAAGAPHLAAELLMPLAEKGDPRATQQLALALRDSGGFGPEVMTLLHHTIKAGRLDALGDYVSVADDPENPVRYTPEAFTQLKLAAKLGAASAWMPLGERYEHGHGTEPDIGQALAAYEKALAAGDRRAAAKLSAKKEALERAAAYVRSWNEMSVATLLDHVAAGQGRFYELDHPAVEVLLRQEEELRACWPLRRISVAEGARAEPETLDLIKVKQPYQFEVQRGERIARGKGVLTCTVQRDTAEHWRITSAADQIELGELLPAKEQFLHAESLRELKPAFTPAEQMEEMKLEILEQTRGLEMIQDFKPALAVVLKAVEKFPQEKFWMLYADKVCDRMARQLFNEGKWLDAGWVENVHHLALNGSISALLLEGHLCAAGYGCERDAARSVALYQQAFELSKRRDARFYYAEALFQGNGVPQDAEKAGALVLVVMSRSKHPLEAYLVAHLLWRKAEHDPALWQDVYDSLSRVAEKFSPAKNLAGMVLLNHGQTTRERKTGFAAIKAAAEEGVVEAMKNLVQCYQEGVGCEKDVQQATFWKQKALVTEPPRRKHYTEFEE
ncbi:hypothetical protein [Prosthecobacter vanneervenii]|uniref:TPR repeat protein n=1 Tax=Prosthecobacter vanneervenii TaxID=48466 RepID=A0A7W7YC55_9BACT|nr:hypothetical protein [Prosthecobacter vanneervenii]MBB5033464.1 TPR repeat protein [Prosthecobacter vanneervenii]